MLSFFRGLSVIEGLSLIALMGIAMPAKYLFNYPDLIPPVGMAHGLLWLLYIVISLMTAQLRKWSVAFWAFLLLMSIVPFGFIVVEWQMQKKMHQA